MKILLQVAIVFLICLMGEGISSVLPFAFPGSVISMILLFLLLICKILKIGQIKEKSEFLLQNMAIFFIPAGVSIIQYYDVIKGSIIKIFIICIITTFATFAATAFTVTIVIRIQNAAVIKNRDAAGGKNK